MACAERRGKGWNLIPTIVYVLHLFQASREPSDVTRCIAGLHTVRKLDKLEAYLRAYLNVLKNQSGLQTFYFDAFAGTGEIPTSGGDESLPLDDEGKAFIAGSAKRALGLDGKFAQYIFVEKSRRKAQELERIVREQHAAVASRVRVVNEDANVALRSFCDTTNWRKSRAVVFLDPYGNQVEWATIEAVAATEAIDLWYLFPAGLGVHRQIGRDARIDDEKRRSLNRLFGTTGWLDECVAPDDGLQGELFDETTPRHTKIATPDSITRYMIKRMKTVFTGGVLDEWLPLGRQGHNSFSLLFAWANPSEKAKKAGEIARAVMRSGRRGRTK